MDPAEIRRTPLPMMRTIRASGVKTPARAAALLAVVFLALHLPFLPVSLEDLDSINFALGLRQFDVAQHQPHPPGYPVFVFVSGIVNAVTASETRALSLVSVVSGALAVLGVAALFGAWSSDRTREWVPTRGALIAASAPLFWMTAARPLSDMAGLASAIGVQVITMRAAAPGAIGTAALCAGLAAGIRPQVVWLTVPVLVLAVVTQARAQRTGAALAAAIGYGIGALLWGIPLLVLSGGAAAYLSALANQGTEDFTGVAMLATRPSPGLLARALYYTFVAPWGPWPLGVAVLAAAAVGFIRCVRANRRALLWLLATFGPYAVFHLLFQETVTTRYALPLVVPVAYLAVYGGEALPGRGGAALAGVIALVGLVTTMPVLNAYASMPAPAFRALDDMRAAGDISSGAPAPALAMHSSMRRPIAWNGDRLPAWSVHLPAPPKHEWMELVRYWNGGGRAPVWFLADPLRSDLRLVDQHALVKRGEYRWPFEATDVIGGVRPSAVDWYQIAPPNWYLGEGWALTPETAGVAKNDGRGPGRAPIQGWIRRRPGPVTLMIGGRNLAGGGPEVPVTVSIDGRSVLQIAAAPGFFLKFLTLEAGSLDGQGEFATLTVAAGTDTVAIEQFDLQPAGLVVYGFGDGWHELEYNPATGRLWRWTSERAVIPIHSIRQPLVLQLSGQFETAARTAHLVVRSGDRVVSERDVPRRFSLDVAIPAASVSPDGETRLTIETDQWFIPAETSWRPTRDRRHLGLRLFQCELRPGA